MPYGTMSSSTGMLTWTESMQDTTPLKRTLGTPNQSAMWTSRSTMPVSVPKRASQFTHMANGPSCLPQQSLRSSLHTHIMVGNSRTTKNSSSVSSPPSLMSHSTSALSYLTVPFACAWRTPTCPSTDMTSLVTSSPTTSSSVPILLPLANPDPRRKNLDPILPIQTSKSAADGTADAAHPIRANTNISVVPAAKSIRRKTET